MKCDDELAAFILFRMVEIKVPANYKFKPFLEIAASFNKASVPIVENASVTLPTLVLADKSEVYGFSSIACALARLNTATENWAQEVLGDGKPEVSGEIYQYISFAESFFNNTNNSDFKLFVGQIQKALKGKKFLIGANLTLADVLLFLAIHPICKEMTEQEKKSFIQTFQWLEHVNEALQSPFEKIVLPQVQQKQKKPQQEGQQHQPREKQPKQPKAPKAQPAQDTRDPLSKIDIRVAQIVKVWPHPEADSLYCEEVDIGTGTNRRVVTGVRNFYTEEEMQNRRIVVITNLKPSKIRGQPSESMVYAASIKDGDTEKVELLVPPADAPVGTRVVCGTFVEGDPIDLDKNGKAYKAVEPEKNFKIDENGNACYKGVPFSVPQGNITVPTLRNCEFH